MYLVLECPRPCPRDFCIDRGVQHKIIVSELASTDLSKLLKSIKGINQAAKESALTQACLALQALHDLCKFNHGDAHTGNFLVHNVAPGGWWAYKLGNDMVYVPNMGHLVVLWDFGLSKKYDDTNTDFKLLALDLENDHNVDHWVQAIRKEHNLIDVLKSVHKHILINTKPPTGHVINHIPYES